MNRISTLLPILVFTLLLSACADTPDNDPEVIEQDTTMMNGAFDTLGTDTTISDTTNIGAAEMRDGVQEVRVQVRSDGYSPARVTLREGVPARMVFIAEGNTGCASQVQVPQFGVERTDLTAGEETAVEFTPDETGEFTFACGMDMIEGTIVVRA